MKLPVLMATCETPYITCLALSSYLEHNKDVDSEFHIGSATEERSTKSLLSQIRLKIPINKYDQNGHGYILNCLYRDFAAESKYFLTMDSDIEFLRPGYIAAMVKLMDQTNHYCVSSEKTDGFGDYLQRTLYVCMQKKLAGEVC
jgi:hypothetical protein